MQRERIELGQVLTFAPLARARRPFSAAAPDDARRGTILLFTGVRYERPIASSKPDRDAAATPMAG